MFVSISAFEPIAQEEANSQIPETRIEDLVQEFRIPEVWKISRCFSSVTLFVFTDEQIEKLKNSPILKEIESRYFELLKEYDEFNFWKEKNFKIGIDSKENFDKNYKSNWYYYYK